jgi:uncharacterized DUF497 family protein
MNVFAWDIPKAIANFEKHGVPFEEAVPRTRPVNIGGDALVSQ